MNYKTFHMQVCSLEMPRSSVHSAKSKKIMGNPLIILTMQILASILHATIAWKSIRETETNIFFLRHAGGHSMQEKMFERPTISSSRRFINGSSDDVHRCITTYGCNHEKQVSKDVNDANFTDCSTAIGRKRFRQPSFGKISYSWRRRSQHTNVTADDREG